MKVLSEFLCRWFKAAAAGGPLAVVLLSAFTVGMAGKESKTGLPPPPSFMSLRGESFPQRSTFPGGFPDGTTGLDDGWEYSDATPTKTPTPTDMGWPYVESRYPNAAAPPQPTPTPRPFDSTIFVRVLDPPGGTQQGIARQAPAALPTAEKGQYGYRVNLVPNVGQTPTPLAGSRDLAQLPALFPGVAVPNVLPITGGSGGADIGYQVSYVIPDYPSNLPPNILPTPMPPAVGEKVEQYLFVTDLDSHRLRFASQPPNRADLSNKGDYSTFEYSHHANLIAGYMGTHLTSAKGGKVTLVATAVGINGGSVKAVNPAQVEIQSGAQPTGVFLAPPLTTGVVYYQVDFPPGFPRSRFRLELALMNSQGDYLNDDDLWPYFTIQNR